MGTVGAVAIDKYGNLASATSTGGTPKKLPGRVGDTPIIGAGTYADNNSAAASATGWGETIMKAVLSKTACNLVETNLNAHDAAKLAINILAKRVNGSGGIILIDRNGDIGYAYNTPRMAYAFQQEEGDITIGI